MSTPSVPPRRLAVQSTATAHPHRTRPKRVRLPGTPPLGTLASAASAGRGPGTLTGRPHPARRWQSPRGTSGRVRLAWLGLLLPLLLLLCLAGLAWRGDWAAGPLPPEAHPAATAPAVPPAAAPAAAQASVQPLDATLVAQGQQLARAGNCLACHSLPGRPEGSGGLAITTPFGRIHASNLTPDPATGLGAWREADFLRALRQGISRDGRLLYPAFPYPHYRHISDDDGRALWAWLRSLPPAVQTTPPPALDWPYSSRWALAIWRGLYLEPPGFQADAAQTAEWNRGAYLVQGLGHCGACHDSRNALGAAREPGALDGEFLPGSGWLAPSLRDPAQGGVQDWPLADIRQWLATGQSAGGRANGPMAEVLRHGLQHLPEADLQAMATYLKALPRQPALASPPGALAGAQRLAAGRRLYEQHCADCHGAQGQGAAGVYPALAGNRLLALPDPSNLALVVMHGGFELATPARPRPFGMAPYGPLLSDAELADLLSYLRDAWGRQAGAVDALDINRLREGSAH